MKQIPVSLSELYNRRLPLGRVGENQHVQIVFQCNSIFADYPNATTMLIVTAPGGESYAPEIEKSGTNILWTVTDSDLAREGGGELQLTFTDGQEIIKSYIGKTQIFRSLAENGEVPTPIENWMEQANDKLTDVDNALEGLNGIDATASSLSSDANPTVSVTTVSGHKRFEFGIPAGAKGDPGDLQLDSTLTSSTAAAPADQVGELKSAIDDIYDGKPITVIDTNKLNPAEIEQDKNIEINGNVKDYNGEDISGYIPIVDGKSSVAFTGMNAAGTARVCLPINRILFYNNEKTVTSYINSVPSLTITPIPAGASFVRFVITSGYMRQRQPMIEFIDAIGEISATYVQYEEVVERSHGLDYIDETQQDILERLEDVEEAVGTLEEQVETNTDNITSLQSDVADIIGSAKTVDTLGTFARGGINSSTGAYDSYYQYRVTSPDTITIPKDYAVSIANGFRLYVATFVNGSLSDKGWKTEGYILAKNAVVRLMIARTTEDSSETADVDTFCSKVTISAVSSIDGYQEQIDENAENIANIDAVIPYGLTWDWWITANSVDSFGNAYIGYVDTDGYAGIIRRQPDGVMQYKRLESSVNDDDHNGLATYILSNGRILAIGSHGHGVDNHIICYRSIQPNSIDSMEKLSFDIPQGSTYSYRTTYSQIFSYNGTLFDFMRCTISATGASSVTGYLCLISSDSGSTWTAYQVLTFGDPYITFAQCTDDDKYLKMVLGVNPTSGSYTFKGGVIDLSTYKIYDLNNTEIGQMIPLGTGTYDSSTIAKPTDMTDLTGQTVDGKKGRLFTTARTAKAKTVFLYATAIDSASSDFTYKVFDDGTVTEIGMSGTPFGNVHYISGLCFGKDVDTIYYAKATTEKADGDHELHKVKISNNAVESDTIIAEASMCILRPLFLGNGELATVVGHYNDQNSDGTYNGSFTDWELKPLFTHA